MIVAHYTILLVEDDANDVLLIERAFEKAHLANPIKSVRDGQEAIAYLSGMPPYDDRLRYPLPALILLDLKLPRKSGFEVLNWLRQEEDLRRLPVVILTSSGQAADINRAYELGANSYLVKPVSFEALTQLVQGLGVYWLILNESPIISERAGHAKTVTAGGQGGPL